MRAPDWDELLQMHVSDRGLTHIGSRALCVSADCAPPTVEDLEREDDGDNYDLRP